MYLLPLFHPFFRCSAPIGVAARRLCGGSLEPDRRRNRLLTCGEECGPFRGPVDAGTDMDGRREGRRCGNGQPMRLAKRSLGWPQSQSHSRQAADSGRSADCLAVALGSTCLLFLHPPDDSCFIELNETSWDVKNVKLVRAARHAILLALRITNTYSCSLALMSPLYTLFLLPFHSPSLPA